MVALLMILRDCRVAINTLFKHFLRSDRPQLSSACTKSQLSYVPSEIFNLKRNGEGIYISKFATFASKFFEPVANCSEQTANQNTNCGGSLQICAEKNIRFDCKNGFAGPKSVLGFRETGPWNERENCEWDWSGRLCAP